MPAPRSHAVKVASRCILPPPPCQFWYNLWEDGVNVIKLPYNNSEHHDHAAQLYEFLERLHADDALARRVGEAGQAMFREHLTRETVLLYWRALIKGA